MKYSQDIIKKISKHLAEGKTRIYAVNNAGIGYEAFCQWMKGNIPDKALKHCKGKVEIRKKKAEFSEAIKKAELQGNQVRKGRAIDSIMTAMSKQWTAAAWWLERKHPDEFAEQRKYDHTTGGEKLILNMKPSKFVNKKKKKNDIQPTTTPADIPRVRGKV